MTYHQFASGERYMLSALRKQGLLRRGNAKAAEAAVEEALINRFGALVRLAQPHTPEQNDMV